MQASDRLFYFYQTLLDCHSALEQLGSEAEQAQAEAQKRLQVTSAATKAPTSPLYRAAGSRAAEPAAACCHLVSLSAADGWL